MDDDKDPVEIEISQGIYVDAGVAFEESYVIAEFPAGTPGEEVSLSYEGKFYQYTVEVPIPALYVVGISGCVITGEKRWVGGGLSLNLGLGAGAATVVTYYELINDRIYYGPNKFYY